MKTVTVQETGKLWKGCQFIGALALIAGAVSCTVLMQSAERPGAFTALLLGVGLALFVIGRGGAWWFHR